MEATAKQAQRLWPRWFIAGSNPVKVDLGPAGAGVLVDVSGGGIRVQSMVPLRRMAEVPVRIDIPDKSSRLQCSGIVVWSKPTGAAGIRFINLGEGQQNVLRGWLADLEKTATSPPQSQPQDEFTSIVSQIRAAQMHNADALNMIARRVTELTSASGSTIALGTPENMVYLAAAGVAHLVGTPVPAGAGLTGVCVLRRKMVYCQNTKNDPRVSQDFKFGSAVILPLMVNGEVRGVLEAFSKETDAFDSASIDAIERLADAIVFVTYGIVTQRRLTTTKLSSPSPTINSGLTTRNSETSPSQSVPPQSVDRPTSPSPPQTQAANISASAGTHFAKTSTPPMRPRPIVSTPVSKPAVSRQIPSTPPIGRKIISFPVTSHTAPAQSASVTTNISVEPISDLLGIEEPEVPVAIQHTLPSFTAELHPKPSIAGKLTVAIAATLVLTAIPFFVLRHRQSTSVANAAPVANTAPLSSPVVSQVFQPTITASEAHSTSAPAIPVQEARHNPTSAPPSALPHATTKNPVFVIAPESTKAAAPTAQEPIVLAAASSMKHSRSDDDALSAAPQVSAAASAPASNIALPGTSSVPKLTAPVSKTRTGGTLLKRVDPVYPQFAKTAGIHGQVELQYRVNKDGSVDQVRRVSGPAVLASAAIDAVKHWRYDPVKEDGEPVEMQMTVKLNFGLSR